MRTRNLNRVIAVGMLFISGFSYAQKINTEEENSLKFQTHFFEALKQKAIENHDKAITALERCLKLDANNATIYHELGKNYLALKNSLITSDSLAVVKNAEGLKNSLN